MDKNDPVRDDETLYRSIRGDEAAEHYTYDGGKLTIRSKAFMDRCRKPSVDRAELRSCDPSLSRLDETQGIVSLIASDVRAIKLDVHTVDVIYNPTSENPAHSQITITPECCVTTSKQDRVFRSLRTALADIATENGWTLRPAGE